MNALYWYKDVVSPGEVDYLKTLSDLAVELNLEGLQNEIKDYLNILKETK